MKTDNQADKLLRMMETVDKGDTDTLDEIDARLWCYARRFEYVSFDGIRINFKEVGKLCAIIVVSNFQYMHSRDALKAVRDEHLNGWMLTIDVNHLDPDYPDEKISACVIYKKQRGDFQFWCEGLPTECLAEAHTIVSALKHERLNDA